MTTNPAEDVKNYTEKMRQDEARQQTSEIDPYGFTRKNTFNYAEYQQIMSQYLPILTRRTIRWSKVMSNNAKEIRHSRQIKRFCRKGIPSEYRTQVWMDLSGAKRKMNQNPNLFTKMINLPPTEGAGNSAKVESQINTDLDRTFPDNIYFSDNSTNDHKIMLFQVLKAYGNYRPEIGYCQGINYLAGLLLLVTKNAEKSFWLLTCLIDDILPCFYDSTMAHTLTELDVLSHLISEKLPEVSERMKNEYKPWMIISSKWFICLFIDILPIETVLRVWDCMFCEGSKIILRTALYIVMMKQNEIISSPSLSQIKSVFDNLQEDTQAMSCHTFIEGMLEKTNPMKRSKVASLREHYLKIVQSSTK